ncbi:hypothetical protein BDY24DRAFT_382098 [Mrakia frigida]|uniref:uncharacterized protein n=1 Tax=Mrakia frigida TaxID=29902 RepID=UPI003FCC074F
MSRRGAEGRSLRSREGRLVRGRISSAGVRAMGLRSRAGERGLKRRSGSSSVVLSPFVVVVESLVGLLHTLELFDLCFAGVRFAIRMSLQSFKKVSFANLSLGSFRGETEKGIQSGMHGFRREGREGVVVGGTKEERRIDSSSALPWDRGKGKRSVEGFPRSFC